MLCNAANVKPLQEHAKYVRVKWFNLIHGASCKLVTDVGDSRAIWDIYLGCGPVYSTTTLIYLSRLILWVNIWTVKSITKFCWHFIYWKTFFEMTESVIRVSFPISFKLEIPYFKNKKREKKIISIIRFCTPVILSH